MLIHDTLVNISTNEVNVLNNHSFKILVKLLSSNKALQRMKVVVQQPIILMLMAPQGQNLT